MQKNIRKIDKVLGICIEAIYNFRTRDKLSTKVSPFFYLTIGSFNFFSSNLKGSVDSQRIQKEVPFQGPMQTVKVAYFYVLKTHLGMPDIESTLTLR